VARGIERVGAAQYRVAMRMLLTSEGVHNELIRHTLVELLGKPIGQASIVAVIDAILPFGGDNTKTLADLQRLRDLGLTDGEITDVVLAAAARCFFSKTLDALGLQPDASFAQLPEAFRDRLTVGRPIDGA